MAGKVAPDVTETNSAAADTPQENLGLRRAVGVWGSYTWGYADVGADVYVALGIVMAAAQGATNVAFLFAGLVYVMVGLAYTELAAAYPMAGGGQFYALRVRGNLQQINPVVDYIMKNAPCDVLVLSQGQASALQKGANEGKTKGRVATEVVNWLNIGTQMLG
jgi:hypothetical protein